MAISELEAQLQRSDWVLRNYIRKQVAIKQQLTQELEFMNPSVEEEMKLRDGIAAIDNNLQKIQMEGLL
tara:strand:- start:1976 stop:2182 length:207 start_codon:yes stop_codon:yes gene_type:complete